MTTLPGIANEPARSALTSARPRLKAGLAPLETGTHPDLGEEPGQHDDHGGIRTIESTPLQPPVAGSRCYSRR